MSNKMPCLDKLHSSLKKQFFLYLLILLLMPVVALKATAEESKNKKRDGARSDIDTTLVSRPPKESNLDCRYISLIEQVFLANHVKFSDRSKDLENRVIEQYLKRLDPYKIYFTQADVELVKKTMNNLFEKTKSKDCIFLSQIQDIIYKKIQDRALFVKEFLGPAYKFDPKAEFINDPDHKPWAKSQDEINEFMKKYVHFQVANYLATDLKLPEAKKNVIKNYERAVKRTSDVSQDDLYSSYLDSFAHSLDPHSSFFSADILEDFEIQMRLSLEGIGASLSSQDGFTVIEALVPGGAAARSGSLETQDKIVAVGQETGAMENVIDMELSEVVKKIRGKKGTKVRLSILRKTGAEKKRFDVTLIRDKVNLEDEAASISFMEREIAGKKKKIGLINFPSFYADSKRGGRSSAADMKKLLKEARDNKVDGIVLDVSNNGGGSLEDAVKIAGLFFKTGNVVKQSAKGDAAKGEQTLADTDSQVDWAGPLVVLTSRVSASASEILAGTLQDYKRAVIVGGDHTFGKGSVQSVVPIPNNMGAVKVTVGMFFIPGGNSTQHRGVSADITLPSIFNSDEIGEKSLDYSLPPVQIPNFTSESAFVKEGEGAWKIVQADWLKELKDKSTARVAKSEDFKKIEDDLKKSLARGKTIKVSEIMKDKNEKEKKAKAARFAKKEEKLKEYLKRADVNEAVNILGDLLKITGT